MIVRIHMEGQYRLNDEATAEVDKLDDSLLAAVDTGDADAFNTSLSGLLKYVREHGEKVPTDEIVPSDVILPSEDMTLEDARDIIEKPLATSASTTEAPD